MKTKIIKVVFCVLLSITTFCVKSQNIHLNWWEKQNIGIAIKDSVFDKMVITYIEMMKNHDMPTVGNAIDMIRICNTIELDRLSKSKEIYSKYEEHFIPIYIKIAGETLDGEPSLGMAYYSRKYNIWIGGIPTDESYANSIYCIVKTD